MDAKLFTAIDNAEDNLDDLDTLKIAIVAMSINKSAKDFLLKHFRDAAADYEFEWQRAENMPEFKARYTAREQARKDFLAIKNTQKFKKR